MQTVIPRLILNCYLLLADGLLEGLGASPGMERPDFAVDGLCVWLVGNLPTAVRSPSKLASFEDVCSSLGVEIHDDPVDSFGEGVIHDVAVAVTAF